MTFKRNAMGLGTGWGQADALVGGVVTTIAGAGTTHSDATLLPFASNVWVTTAANNSGLIIPPGNGSTDTPTAGDFQNIYNDTANTILLYPPLGGTLNSGTATTGTVSIPTHTSVQWMSLDGALKFSVSGPTT